jgi:hypothetical protein
MSINLHEIIFKVEDIAMPLVENQKSMEETVSKFEDLVTKLTI